MIDSLVPVDGDATSLVNAGAAGTFLSALRMDPKAANRQKQREELLEMLPNNAGLRIMSCHNELQKLADTLDQHVGSLLDAHEQDFFVAYRTHMATVQREFKILKTKADEQETKMRRQAKIASLEKELRWFMKEALRLDELCKKYKLELEKWKQHADQLDDDRAFLEDQIKKAKAQNKHLRASVEKAQQTAYEALAAHEKNDPVEVAALESLKEEELPPQSTLSEDMVLRYRKTIRNLQHLLQAEQRKTKKLEVTLMNTPGPQPLEEYFVNCITQVKHEIFNRRLNQKNAFKSVDHISTDDFTTYDKRCAIDFLFRNKELLALLEKKLEELYQTEG